MSAVRNELYMNGILLPYLSENCPDIIEPVRNPTNMKLAYREFNESDTCHSFLRIGIMRVNKVI